MKWKEMIEKQGMVVVPYTYRFSDGTSSTIEFIQYMSKPENVIGYVIPDRNIVSLYYLKGGWLMHEDEFIDILTKCNLADHECVMKNVKSEIKEFPETKEIYDTFMTRLRSVANELIDIYSIEEGKDYIRIPIPEGEHYKLKVPFGTNVLYVTVDVGYLVNEVFIPITEAFIDGEIYKVRENSEIYIDKNGNKWFGKIEGNYYVVRKHGGAK